MTILIVICAILVFSLLVFVHELGHFVTAKLSGVQVNAFAIFMGPPIFKWQRGETTYSIGCIPFGGYCAMEGEDEETDNPRAFTRAAAWKRVIILAAGAFMNFVMGLVLLLVIFGTEKDYVFLKIDSFTDYATVDDYGLQVGDEIVELDGEKIYLSGDFSMLLALNPGEIHDITVLRDGERVELKDFRMERHTVEEAGGTREMLGITFTRLPIGFGDRLKLAWNGAMNYIRTVRLSLGMMFRGEAGIRDMTGPVGIVDMMVESASAADRFAGALLTILDFGALISINLAVMNLLPIPALDGGRIVCLVITEIVEKITGKRINPKYEGYLHTAALVLLLGLMAVIFLKDITNLFR